MSPETKHLRARLAGVPAPTLTPTPAIERAIAASVAYLGSEAALRSLDVDPYWPKWDSPWWHMLLLHELGEASRIPASAAAAMVASLDRLPLHSFPIQPGDAPPGTDLSRDISCHCALGSMYQVLAACGVDVDHALPWIVPWFVRYQMADGGLNCDEHAYLRTDECPSSMVGTVAPFEAMLVRGQPDPFLDRGARFLIERTLSQGSPTVHNAAERTSAPAWRLPCFPRFYYYDVLRGLAALVRWSTWSGQPLPREAIAGVVAHLVEQFPDGIVHVERRSYEGRTTVLPGPQRSPSLRGPTSSFALLDATSVIGAPSAALTRQWTATRRDLLALIDAGQLAA
ncbi:MAG: hypothetical protein ABIY55_16245 [Kofleriaceae bacterium]